MKDYDNLIIKCDDPRYGKLGHLWKNYDWNSVQWHKEGFKYKYYIPPELVLTDYRKGRSIKSFDPLHELNWVTQISLKWNLTEQCNLSVQEFFDLIALKINNKSDRPRCHQCNNFQPFSGRFRYGYNQTMPWDNHNHIFCSKSCSAQYQQLHREEFGLTSDKFSEITKRRYEDPKERQLTSIAMHKSYGTNLDIVEYLENHPEDLRTVNQVLNANPSLKLQYRFKNGDVIQVDSTLELRYLKIFESLNLSVSKCLSHFPYVYEEKTHEYYPDFIINFNDGKSAIVEIKSWMIYNYDKDKTDAKWKMIEEYCKLNNLEFYVVWCDTCSKQYVLEALKHHLTSDL